MLKEPSSTLTQLPTVCNLDAIPAPERAAHVVTAQELFAAAQEVTEIENGIEIALPGDVETFAHATAFVAHERECCAFFTFTLQVQPAGAPLYLRLTGGEDVKKFLLSEFGGKFAVPITPGVAV